MPNKNANKIINSNTVVWSVFIYFVWMLFHAKVVFQQFSLFEIFCVAAFYAFILCGLSWIFFRDHLKIKTPFTIPAVLFIAITVVIMILLSNTLTEHYLGYYRVYPFTEIAIGSGWHKDSAFHISIINNILNFGYPSIGQHDTPVLFYHVLSHYVDSALLWLTGMDPFETYALMLHFKIFLFISTILLLVGSIMRNAKQAYITLGFIVLAPLLIGQWNAIGSQGLWFVSILVLFTFPKVYITLTSNNRISNADYVFLFILILVLSTGKISSGFMYAVFIGFVLLIQNVKDFRLYLLGLFWVLFFVVFMNLMSGSGGTATLSISDIVSQNNFSTRIEMYSKITGIQILQILMSSAIFLVFFRLYKDKHFLAAALSALAGVVIFFVLTQLYSGFNRGAVLYFALGLSMVVTLFVFNSVVDAFLKGDSAYFNNDTVSGPSQKKIFLVIVLIGSTFLFSRPSFSLFHLGPKQLSSAVSDLNNAYFINLNQSLSADKQVSFSSLLQGDTNLKSLKNSQDVLLAFNQGLHKYLETNQLSTQNSLLYVSKEIFENDITAMKGHTWASGMLMYAVTRVPLVHGLQMLRVDHGYADYSEKALWTAWADFDSAIACEFDKFIVVAKDFKSADFFHFDCKNQAKYVNIMQKSNSL